MSKMQVGTPVEETHMDIILSTRNPSKAEQIKAIFAGTTIRILTLDDVGIKGDAVEDGETIQDNAYKKALFAHEYAKHKNVWTMADDTGFFIDALGGRPGVHAARWAGDVPTEKITAHTLKQLEGKENRRARFETAVVVVDPDENPFFYHGTVQGKILTAPRVPPQPKMPYSSIFVPEGTDLVWAQMTVVQENAISHRGKAFRAAQRALERMLNN